MCRPSPRPPFPKVPLSGPAFTVQNLSRWAANYRAWHPARVATMSDRRLPVYLVIDCSESMAGPAIEAVNRGLQMLVGELRGNPLALESAYLSVITFARHARQDVPLT